MAQGDHTRRRKADKRRPCTWPHMMIQEEKLVVDAEQQDQALKRLDEIAEEYGMDD